MRLGELATALACASALAACGRPEVRASGSNEASVTVRHFGALHRIVHEGSTEPRVGLERIVPGPHAFAVGALSELRGELTIIDDTIWLAYPADEGGARVERVERSDERATLLVAANVARWQRVELDRDVAFDELDAFVEATARAHGVDPGAPFPFRIEGPTVTASWHVIDGRRMTAGGGHASHIAASVREERRGARASIVGFYSRRHEGVFTHMGRHTHMHIVVAEPPGSGHVDHVDVARGATLMLPAPP